ncbi:MAG TPA: ATPase [Allosphingosinicella sp.]|jgi:uncharacterized protein YndB with AHSA1/START domain
MRILFFAAALTASSAALGEVKSSGPGGFRIEAKQVVSATPAETWAMLGRIGEWWSKDHTYSGNAANLSLELRAGGCFCERLPAEKGKSLGGVAHGRVLTAMPGSMLVLDAPLGPLQSEAAVGRLTWSLRAVAGGTEVTQSFVAGGYFDGKAEKLAPLVDQVLSQQLHGLKRRLAR